MQFSFISSNTPQLAFFPVSNNTNTVSSQPDGFVGIGSLSTGNLGGLGTGVALDSFAVTMQRTPVSGTDPLNASFQVRLNYDLVNTSGVPEPSTMALLGSSLVGLAALARRRK